MEQETYIKLCCCFELREFEMKPARWWLSVRRREPGYEGDRPFSIPEEVVRIHLVEIVPAIPSRE